MLIEPFPPAYRDVYLFNNNKAKAVQLATEQSDWRLEQLGDKLVGFK